MARPKGSKNRSTIARENAAKANKPVLDKLGNLIRNGETVGRVEFDDGVFVGMNFLTQKKVIAGDLEQVEGWLLSQF